MSTMQILMMTSAVQMIDDVSSVDDDDVNGLNESIDHIHMIVLKTKGGMAMKRNEMRNCACW